jgi:aminoglycoside 6-adenylyltransferase
MINKFKGIIENIICLCELSNKIFAGLIIGSQARNDKPADEYSDLDVIIIVDDPTYFLESDEWLTKVGKFHISFIENTPFGGLKERRILFDGALDVDFVFIPKDMFLMLCENNEAEIMFGKGYRFFVDKIGIQNSMPKIVHSKQTYSFPSELHFVNLVSDFWYHCVWTLKKIKRGEYWSAYSGVDIKLKFQLLEIIELHAHAIHGIQYDTWHHGRFIEKWAESWIIDKLSKCFSHYNREDIKNALLSTMDLFRTVAVEISEKLKYKYPTESDVYVTNWIKENTN